MRHCHKCSSAVKDWDVVCPVCGQTLIPVGQTKDSMKVKSNLPGWDEFQGNIIAKPSKDSVPDQSDEFDKRLVRAAIKSDYEKGKEPPQKAIKALGQISFLNDNQNDNINKKAENINETEEVEELEAEEIEAIHASESEGEESIDEINPSDIIEDNSIKEGPIIFEGKKRDQKPESEQAVNIKPLLDAPLPPPSTGKFKVSPLPRVAPPPQGIIYSESKLGEESKVETAGKNTGSITKPKETIPAPAPIPEELSGSPATHPEPGEIKLQRRPRINTIPAGKILSPLSNYNLTGDPPLATVIPQSTQTSPKEISDVSGSQNVIQDYTPTPPQKYDPETLKRIMLHARQVAMSKKQNVEKKQISLPLAILLITMGVLSIAGIAMIIYLLIVM